MLNSVGEINNAAKNPQKLIEEAEKNYIDEIYSAAKQIADDDRIKIVALAGPSASGKTTSAYILCKRLEELGEKTEVVSLDDFYLSPEKIKVLPNGEKDFVSVEALNLDVIKKCFTEIINTGKTVLPRYDFKKRKSILNYRGINVGERGIIIAEGLHALNPVITDLVPRENIFKIYVSVNCSIEDNFGEQLLSSRQIRLARRTIRDKYSRGYPVEETLKLWSGVVDGERKYLYVFKKTADVWIKTLHNYEPGLYKDKFKELKAEVTPDMPFYEYFLRTASALEKFDSIAWKFVPENSLIREFIGND